MYDVLTTGAIDDDGLSPLSRAMENYNPHFNICLYLVNNYDCGNDQERSNLLCKACGDGELNVVKELLENHKVDPNGENCQSCFSL